MSVIWALLVLVDIWASFSCEETLERVVFLPVATWCSCVRKRLLPAMGRCLAYAYAVVGSLSIRSKLVPQGLGTSEYSTPTSGSMCVDWLGLKPLGYLPLWGSSRSA